MNKYCYAGKIYLSSGMVLANGFTRIVHGGRGAYVEFARNQINFDALYLPEKQAHTYFIEHRTRDCNDALVYEQLKPVGYADYRVGMFYISPIYLAFFEKTETY